MQILMSRGVRCVLLFEAVFFLSVRTIIATRANVPCRSRADDSSDFDILPWACGKGGKIRGDDNAKYGEWNEMNKMSAKYQCLSTYILKLR
jgi:hypothetical protein